MTHGTVRATGLVLAAALLSMHLSCTDFARSFDRIDDDMVRLLDLVYEPAEAAPGDTVVVYAVFAGKPITPAELSWRIANDVVVNKVAVTTPRNVVDLDPISVSETRFSTNTNCIRVAFRLDPDLVRNSSMIPDDWASLLPNGMELPIPPALLTYLDRDTLIGIVEAMARSAPGWAVALSGGADTASIRDSLRTADTYYGLYELLPPGSLAALVQILTIRVRLFARVEGEYTIESDYSVRYNRHFADLPGSGVPVNTNPLIDSVGIYRVSRPDLIDFDPANSSHSWEWYPLFLAPDSAWFDTTIVVDKGYSYFVAGYSSRVDSTITIEAALRGGNRTVETHKSQWFYQLKDGEVADVSPGRFPQIMNMRNLIEAIHPATDNRVRTATIWLQVYDDLINELFRPRGSTLAEAHVKFSYTKQYLDGQK